MLVVAVMALSIWLIGRTMRVPAQARWLMIGLLYVSVLLLHAVLPDGAPLRIATGESAAPWLLLGGAAALVLVYRAGLRWLRTRANASEQTQPGPTGPFRDAELERYARHIVLREIGGVGQKRLKDARVLVVGAGGLGAPALLYLAGAGVGTIGVIDDDTVSLSNLARQVIHTDARTGMPKVFSAQQSMLALNPDVAVRPYNRRLTSANAAELMADYDLVLDGSDSFETRELVNAACVASGRPLISGAIGQWEGQVSLFDPVRGAPCRACVFPERPAPGLMPTCAEGGVASPLPGVIGTLMALEAVKEITGAGEGLAGRMLIYDALGAEMRVIRVRRDPACRVCGGL